MICCWFLLDETFAVVLTNGNTVADHCSTVLLERFHPLTEHAPYVTPTDRRLAPRGRHHRRRRCHHRAVPGRGSSSWESPTPPAEEDVAVQRFTDICRTSVVTSLQANRFLFYLFSSLSFGDPLDSRALRFILLSIDYCCLLFVSLHLKCCKIKRILHNKQTF